MERLDMQLADFERAIAGQRVLVTGHTGFTGTWALQWLSEIGAEVTGFALAPETEPSMFAAAQAQRLCARHVIGDLRDLDHLRQVFAAAQPDLVLHLGAQTLVRRSYRDPAETWSSNVMGTIHVLEAARTCDSVRAVLCITTDKVYDNKEWLWAYRENDALGGKDPYSASKAACEIAIASHRASLASWGRSMAIMSARGGNIIGGGDWAEDRLVPDIARAAAAKAPIVLRNPSATRPWQHVLCLVHGYLMLLARACQDGAASPEDWTWNLGPSPDDCIPVGAMVERFAQRFGGLDVRHEAQRQHEAQLLMLDSAKARARLGWRPAWDLDETIARTADWYREQAAEPDAAGRITREQLAAYRRAILEG